MNVRETNPHYGYFECRQKEMSHTNRSDVITSLAFTKSRIWSYFSFAIAKKIKGFFFTLCELFPFIIYPDLFLSFPWISFILPFFNVYWHPTRFKTNTSLVNVSRVDICDKYRTFPKIHPKLTRANTKTRNDFPEKTIRKILLISMNFTAYSWSDK